VFGVHNGARFESTKVPSLQIQKSSGVGIGRQVHLKTSIQQEPVDSIGPNAATDGIFTFQHQDRPTGSMQLASARQTRQSGSDNNNRTMIHTD
jgi:hypothetical protein